MDANPGVQVAADPHAWQRVVAFFKQYGGSAPGIEAERRLLHPRYRDGLARFITVADGIACAALLQHDRWQIDGAVVDSGTVVIILTHPTYRDQGLFGELLSDCLGYFRDEGIPLVQARGPVALLAPFGFTPIYYHALVTIPARLAADLPAYGRVRGLVEADLPEAAALYADTYARLAASAELAPGEWRWRLPDLAAAEVWEDESGAIAAYAVSAQQAGGARQQVSEAAAADTRSALALLQALGTETLRAAPGASDALSTLQLALPLGHPVARAAVLAGGTARVIAPLENGDPDGNEDQAKVVDLAGALRALAPALMRRLQCSRYLGWQGRIGMDTEEAAVNLEINSQGVRVAPRDAFVDDTLYLPSPLLAPLCLGTYGARDLTAWPGVRLSVTLLGLLDVLFPPRWPSSPNYRW
jgi:hypothetical protein